MRRKRHFIVLTAAMTTVAWAAACGDGGTAAIMNKTGNGTRPEPIVPYPKPNCA